MYEKIVRRHFDKPFYNPWDKSFDNPFGNLLRHHQYPMSLPIW